MNRTDRIRLRTFLEEEEKEEEEMQERFSYKRKWFSDRRTVPCQNDNDDWKVGAWRSTTGVYKIAGGWSEEAAARRERGLSREESSFESLDFRATEVLDISIQALESCTSLTSCAFGTTTEYPHWEGRGGGCDVEKGEQDVVVSSQDWDPSERVHSGHRGGLTTRKPKPEGFHGCEHDIARVLEEMVNNNIDYGVKVSTFVTKTPQDSIDRFPVKDMNVLSVKENRFEGDRWGHYARGRFWNGSQRTRPADDCQELPNPVSRDAMSSKGADGEGRRASAEKTRVSTLDRLTQAEVTGLSSCRIRPPKGKRSGDLRLPTSHPGEFQRKINLVASQRRKKRSLKNNHCATDPHHSEQRKLIFPSKPPKWKGLSTALSVVRSICHGAGAAGVVDTQIRPLLIIAGKCVFRTAAPLDTPRLCTISHRTKCPVPRAGCADEDSLPPPKSADGSTQDTRKESSHNQLASKPLPPLVTKFHGPPSTTPGQNKCQSTSASIKRWPAVVTELDNWISQIVNEWLDKDDLQAAVAKSALSHPAVTTSSPVRSRTVDVLSEEKLEVFGAPPVSNMTEFFNRLSKSLPNKLEELTSAPSKKLIDLDASIGQVQTVRDLSQLLEPMSQACMSSVPGSNVAGNVKISPMSIIQEFGEDGIVQEFQRQIRALEQENVDLKSSLYKEENTKLFRRMKALHI